MTQPSPSLCYLCGQTLAPPLSQDHVPPRQFYADAIRKAHHPNLRTITVHKSCNLAYQFDEDYFVNTMAPFARGSNSGNALLQEIFQKYHSGTARGLVQKVYEEFERRPSGLTLPSGLIAKRIEGHRVHRIAWKLVRGLYFHHYGQVLPEDTPNGLKIVPPDQPPPKEFIIALPDDPVRGQYPGVFDYKFAKFPEVHDFHYWGMLLWGRLILIVTFHDPACSCAYCVSSKSALASTSAAP